MKRLVTILVAIGAALLLVGGTIALLNNARPMPSPTPMTEAVVVRVNGEAITAGQWLDAYAVDRLMSAVTRQPAPTPDETLERLINDALLLQRYPQPVPDDEAVAKRLADIEASTGVTRALLSGQLTAMGVPGEALTATMRHLLRVQAADAALQAEGKEPASWLTQARQEAIIEIDTKAKRDILARLFGMP